jgi:hypothetical protein
MANIFEKLFGTQREQSPRPQSKPSRPAPSSSRPAPLQPEPRQRFSTGTEIQQGKPAQPRAQETSSDPSSGPEEINTDGVLRIKSRAAQQASVTSSDQASEQDDELRAATADKRILASRAQGLANTQEKQLSDAEYFALSPEQRAMIDFNTQMLDALRADAGEKQAFGGSKWTQDVQGLFPDSQGEQVYSPRALEVLKAFGIGPSEDGHNSNYEDFLNFNNLASEKDIAGLDPAANDQFWREYTASRQESRKETKNADGTTTISFDPTLETEDVLRTQRFDQISGQALSSLGSANVALGDTVAQRLRRARPDLFGEAEDLIGSAPDASDRDHYLNQLYQVMSQTGENAQSPEDIAVWVGDIEREFGLANNQIYDYLERRLQQEDYSATLKLPDSRGADQVYLSPAVFRALYFKPNAG